VTYFSAASRTTHAIETLFVFARISSARYSLSGKVIDVRGCRMDLIFSVGRFLQIIRPFVERTPHYTAAVHDGMWKARVSFRKPLCSVACANDRLNEKRFSEFAERAVV
jgi:hypothetical protein